MRTCIYIFSVISLLVACQNNAPEESIIINEEMLLHNLQALSHDSLQGRFFGTEGNYKTQKYIAEQFDSLGITPAFTYGSIQKFPFKFEGEFRQKIYPISNPNANLSNVTDTTVYGGNVVALLKGKKEKTIVITGHLDHLGMKDGKIFNGADDNASGLAALLTMANYFKNNPIEHTLIFAAVDAEEIDLLGVKYLLKNFPIEVENIVLNVNMDMISRNDHSELYAAGSYHYPHLKRPLNNLNDTKIKLQFGHDDPNNKKEEDWTYSSDHYEFHKKQIPFIYFGVEGHEDFHKPTDTYANINQDFYINSVKLIIEAIKEIDSFLSTNSKN